MFRRGVSEFEALSHNDQALVHTFLAAHMLVGTSVFRASRAGQFDPSLADTVVNFCAVLIKSRGIEQWWRFHRLAADDEFVAHIEGLAETESLPSLVEVFPWYGLESQEMGA